MNNNRPRKEFLYLSFVYKHSVFLTTVRNMRFKNLVSVELFDKIRGEGHSLKNFNKFLKWQTKV